MMELAFHKKRRTVVRSSITRLETKLSDLESNLDSPILPENTHSLSDRLKALKTNFKIHQLAIVDRTNDEAQLTEEQQALDDNDDIISSLNIRIQQLLQCGSPPRVPESVRVAGRQIAMVQSDLRSINDVVGALTDSEEGIECTLSEYRDRVSEIKADLSKLKASLSLLNLLQTQS